MKIHYKKKLTKLSNVMLPDFDAFRITFIDLNKISCILGPNIPLTFFNIINKGDNKFYYTILLVVSCISVLLKI